MEIGSGLALRLGFVHPLTPKIPHPQIRAPVSIRLRVGLALGLGFVYTLTPKFRTPKFEFQLASGLG